jgi:hypothetical protein
VSAPASNGASFRALGDLFRSIALRAKGARIGGAEGRSLEAQAYTIEFLGDAVGQALGDVFGFGGRRGWRS